MVLYIHVIHKLLWYIRDWDQINTKHYCAENAVAWCVIFNQKFIFLLEKKSSLKKMPFLPFVSEGHNNWLGFCFLLTRHSLNVLFSPRLLGASPSLLDMIKDNYCFVSWFFFFSNNTSTLSWKTAIRQWFFSFQSHHESTLYGNVLPQILITIITW